VQVTCGEADVSVVSRMVVDETEWDVESEKANHVDPFGERKNAPGAKCGPPTAVLVQGRTGTAINAASQVMHLILLVNRRVSWLKFSVAGRSSPSGF
jgi:hypothetical protein